jgi:hypothetical protein
MALVRLSNQSDLHAWAEMRAKLWPSASADKHLLDLNKSFGLNKFNGWVAIESEHYRKSGVGREFVKWDPMRNFKIRFRTSAI